MERLGLGYETLHQLNPRLVYAKGTGYGETGPFANLPAMDLTIQAVSGAMSTTGFPDQPPVKSGPAFADFLGGVHLFAGILAALHERSRSGEGRSVEVAMYDTMIPTLTSPLAALMSDRLVSDRVGNRHSGLAIAPYNVYEASDGYLAILCVSAKHWLRLTVCMARQDLAEDPRFVRQHLRAQNMDELDAIVEEWTKTRTRDELLTLLRQSGVPAAPVQTVREVAQDPHLHERGALQWLRHDQLGQVLVPGCPIRIGENTPITGISPHLDGEGEQFRRQVRDAVLQVDAEEHLMAAPSNRPSQEST
jgi:formyl-CoA transferase